MREIIFRLIKNGETIGYELHQKGHIFHLHCMRDMDCDNFLSLFQTVSTFYIEHDAKDQFAGLLDPKGDRIFEGDKVNLCFTPYEGVEGATECNWDGYLKFNPWGIEFVTECKDSEGQNVGNLLSAYYDFSEEAITVTGSIHNKAKEEGTE